MLARAFEAEGGRNVGAQNSAIVSDAPYLVGVKPDGDLTFVQRAQRAHGAWLAVNQQLQPVAADDLTLEWVQRKFVSVLTQQGNSTFKYVSRLREIVRDTRSVQMTAPGSLFPLPTAGAGRLRAGAAQRVGRRAQQAQLHRRGRGEPVAIARARTPSCRFSSTRRSTAAATRLK